MYKIEMMQQIETNILALLKQKGTEIVKGSSLNSPRAIGDAVQSFLSDNNGIESCIPKSFLSCYESGFARRSMEDMAFYDKDKCYYAIDCKTHNLNTVFNMPNLISVKRLANFYKNDKNFFCILIVEYEVKDNKISYNKCYFKPIEAFSWNCLTFGALGWGQIQIANANNLIFNDEINRKDWMMKLCDLIEIFYDEEIGKINTRKDWFNEIKAYWEKHQ